MQDEYVTDEHGIIRSPGKFEGEPRYVPWFWMHGLEGWASEDNGSEFIFVLEEGDKDTFPELKGFTTLLLWENSSGFVFSELK